MSHKKSKGYGRRWDNEGFDGVPDPHIGYVGSATGYGGGSGFTGIGAHVGKGFKTCRHDPKPVQIGDVVLYATARRDLAGAMLDPFDIVSPLVTSSFLQLENYTGLNLWFPITDYQAPDAKQLRIHCNRLIQFARNGCKVAVFCEGGHGRTGLVLAACIALLEPDVDPIDAIRARHCGHAVETQKQIEVVFAAAERELPDHWKPKHAVKTPIVDRPALTPEVSKSFSQIFDDERFAVLDTIREDVERVVIPVANPEPAGEREIVLPMTGSDAAFSRAVKEAEATRELGVRPDGFSYQPVPKTDGGPTFDQAVQDRIDQLGAGEDVGTLADAVAAAAMVEDGQEAALEAQDAEEAGRPYWQNWTEEEQRQFMLRTSGVENEEDEWADLLCTLCSDPFADPMDLVVVTYEGGMKRALHPRCVNLAHKNLRRRVLHKARKAQPEPGEGNQ